jgi:CheY-like chemotaxis protein
MFNFSVSDNTWNKTMEQSSDKPVVLIVESEALIRMSAAHMVEDAGFCVVEAWNADGAIKLLESRDDIRAVFTGIKMSGSMDGLKLAHAIRGRWPPIHLLVTSGANAPKEEELPANSRFIRKPYGADQIAAALRGLFGLDPEPRRFMSSAMKAVVR